MNVKIKEVKKYEGGNVSLLLTIDGEEAVCYFLKDTKDNDEQIDNLIKDITYMTGDNNAMKLLAKKRLSVSYTNIRDQVHYINKPESEYLEHILKSLDVTNG